MWRAARNSMSEPRRWRRAGRRAGVGSRGGYCLVASRMKIARLLPMTLEPDESAGQGAHVVCAVRPPVVDVFETGSINLRCSAERCRRRPTRQAGWDDPSAARGQGPVANLAVVPESIPAAYAASGGHDRGDAHHRRDLQGSRPAADNHPAVEEGRRLTRRSWGVAAGTAGS